MSPLIMLILTNTGWAALLAVVVSCLGLKSILRNRPAVLHLLWFGVLLRLVVPSVVQLPILPPLEQQPASLPSTPAIVRAESKPVTVLPSRTYVPVVPSGLPVTEKVIAKDQRARPFEFRLSMMLVAISLGGTVVLLTLSIYRGRRVVRLLYESQAAPPGLVELAERLANRMHILAVPQVRLVKGLATPSIWIGWRQSTILLPQHLIDTLDDGQWSCIVAHELAHLARRDHWFNLAGAGIVHLYWWNPIAWWAWREMQAQQEACCDAMAISHEPLSRRLYAETLLQVVDSWDRKSHVHPRALLGFGNRSVLTRRFEMIANDSVRPRATAAAMVCLAVGALSFVCLPVRAERPVPAEPKAQVASVPQPLPLVPADDISGQPSKDEPLSLTAPFDAAQAKVAQEAWAKELGQASIVETNSIGMELVLIPPGTFTMGSPLTEKGRKDNEAQVKVTLRKAFYLGKTEVTQAQWYAVIGTSPWKGDEAYVSQGDNYPATNVSWDDAVAFCEKLSAKENASYFLPTEAEWEYACRAGTTTRFSSGDDTATLSAYEWWGSQGGGHTHEVGQKRANPFGLHDMHGNVWEWCEDVYLRKHPGGTDPVISEGDAHRTFRGGVWAINAEACRSAHRRWMLPVDLDNGLGFRVARISAK
ncbi:MAG: hypothetical protein JWN70_3708 [Planctomycetaceae bacterium]|nr:hypothetical protein [Planctomycetaceae bacterium]